MNIIHYNLNQHTKICAIVAGTLNVNLKVSLIIAFESAYIAYYLLNLFCINYGWKMNLLNVNLAHMWYDQQICHVTDFQQVW